MSLSVALLVIKQLQKLHDMHPTDFLWNYLCKFEKSAHFKTQVSCICGFHHGQISERNVLRK